MAAIGPVGYTRWLPHDARTDDPGAALPGRVRIREGIWLRRPPLVFVCVRHMAANGIGQACKAVGTASHEYVFSQGVISTPCAPVVQSGRAI